MSETKLIRLGKKGQIVIPKVLQESIGIDAGDLLLITVAGDQIIITSPEKYAEMTRGLLKGLWGNTPDKVESYLSYLRN